MRKKSDWDPDELDNEFDDEQDDFGEVLQRRTEELYSVPDAIINDDCDVLIRNVNSKYRRIFESRSRADKRAIYRYLFSRKPKKLPPSLKNRVINLYDPMADRSSPFPDGLRWCLNVYVGC